MRVTRAMSCGILLSIFLLTFFATFFPMNALASDKGQYASIEPQGSVTMNGNLLDGQEKISVDDADIRTEKDGYATIKVFGRDSEIASEIIVTPNSEFHLIRPGKNSEESHFLKEGSVRAKVKKRPLGSFKIRTTPAIFGVRGTEFWVTANPIFNEAEVVVFEGTVDVVSQSDSTDHKSVTKGRWDGIGGRYGKKIADPLEIPADSLKILDENSKVPPYAVKTNGASSSTGESHKAE